MRLGFLSYLGYPLFWPDGEIFGTLCVLDRRENTFDDEAREHVTRVKRQIERDLAVL